MGKSTPFIRHTDKNGLRIRPFGVQSLPVNFFAKLKARFAGKVKPEHLRRGELGERAAETHLKALGMKFLARNFTSARGEIDLIFQDKDCLVFTEVDTRFDIVEVLLEDGKASARHMFNGNEII